MSEKRSWDIQPRRKVQQPAPQAPAAAPRPQPQPIPQRRPGPTLKKIRMAPAQRRPAPRPAPAAEQQPIRSPIRRERIPQGQDRESLKIRRKRARRRWRTILTILVLCLLIACVAALWLPALRIQSVQAAGPDQTGVQHTTLASLVGTYYFAIPRDSIFFFPSAQIRAQILAKYPDISAVSINRTSFSTILISSIPRESAFIWCGENYAGAVQTPILATASSTGMVATSTISTASSTEPVSQAVTPTCYNADAQGFIFSTTNNDPSAFHIYGALMHPGMQPIGEQMANAASIPAALNFVKVLRDMNVPITSLVIRGDEADLYTTANTRITYVLGKEQQAEQLAEAAFKDLNLTDGSLVYVDLRFDGKVYFKKSGS